MQAPTGTRILVLEDEAIIALDLEGILSDAGFEIAANIPTCAAALEWLEANNADGAILDLTLLDGPCDEVARRLVAANIPFLVFSGSSPESGVVDPALLMGSWLGKPAPSRRIVAAVLALMSVQV
ncbi:hypothetical protein ASE63_26310 [Bosea sp. Root381]|uniref:response regulator n=1 Tax=Bosea sp. Root381 TaxID=1736524 RepID=UPI0006F287C3|nr:response regulator [Bosea sp. Root381]KRE00641.1 hypothetical protein ASE63_26310 [Bosea sp. Root381]